MAIQTHRGQKDRAGAPHILHIFKVMLRAGSGVEHMENVEHVAAVVHDVLEDSTLTLEDLRLSGYPQVVLDALEYLTPWPREPYEAFIERIRLNPLATKIKLADLDDNIDLNRMLSLSGRDLKRLEKHLRARITLQQVLEQKNAKPM